MKWKKQNRTNLIGFRLQGVRYLRNDEKDFAWKCSCKQIK